MVCISSDVIFRLQNIRKELTITKMLCGNGWTYSSQIYLNRCDEKKELARLEVLYSVLTFSLTSIFVTTIVFNCLSGQNFVSVVLYFQ